MLTPFEMSWLRKRDMPIYIYELRLFGVFDRKAPNIE
jgi:hypothetical protein